MANLTTSRIDVLVNDPRWKGRKATVLRAAEAAMPKGRSAVTILLADDAEVQVLNHTYRRKNKPTNVLSFPNGAREEGVLQLGDIILAYETVAREAGEQGKTFKDHLTHLVIHGVLHLLGHDHEEQYEANRMESLEIKLLKRMGIANPYESA